MYIPKFPPKIILECIKDTDTSSFYGKIIKIISVDLYNREYCYCNILDNHGNQSNGKYEYISDCLYIDTRYVDANVNLNRKFDKLIESIL